MKFPLRKKIILFILFVSAVFSIVALVITSSIINRIIEINYKTYSESLAKTVAVSIDSEKVKTLRDNILEIYKNTEHKVSSEHWGTSDFDEYINHYSAITESQEYKDLKESLTIIQNSNAVKCIYLIYVNTADINAIYLVDADPEDPCPTGCIDPIYEINYPVLKNPDLGFPAYTTNTNEYGSLMTAGKPVYAENGEIVAYATIDITTKDINKTVLLYTFLAACLFFTLTVIVSTFGYLLVDYLIVRYINQLADKAQKYCENLIIKKDGTGESFNSLTIKTGDEIEILAESMKKMDKELTEYITSLTETRKELSDTKEKAEIMDRIASKDALTGVKNKRVYDAEMERLNSLIKEGNADFGIVMVDLNNLKNLNDNFGHEKGNIAIKEICHKICEIFKHSPVFRIGGDEFSVILENSDLKNHEQLIKSFYDKIAEDEKNTKSAPWERISAALGYAIFDATSFSSAEDVFKKADSNMYEKKTQMKKNMRKEGMINTVRKA